MMGAAHLRLALAATGALLAWGCDAPDPMSGPAPASSNEAAALEDAAEILDQRDPPGESPSAESAPAQNSTNSAKPIATR
ncbi:hypothetical protein [Aurantiacibacter suaedae]|uniref:hypothetical protein n=1 Tax=Aurantiacibacter suaedae TaxID=2545755 RepID=UPI0010F49895|nr:hypothetical protein [Aurantiacibacter suaedae]